MEVYKVIAMSTNSGAKNNSDNPANSSTNLGEQDNSEKVEVGDLILHKCKNDCFLFYFKYVKPAITFKLTSYVFLNRSSGYIQTENQTWMMKKIMRLLTRTLPQLKKKVLAPQERRHFLPPRGRHGER